MQIRFIAQASAGARVFEGLAEHARRRLQFRLRLCSERVAHVSVRFGDTGRGAARQDSYCVMQVQLHGAPAATVVDIGADAYDTIDRAADRVGRLAGEQLRAAVPAPASPAASRAES